MEHSPTSTPLSWSVSPPRGGRARLAVTPRAQSGGLFLAEMTDQAGYQREIIRMAARTHTNLTFPLGVGQILVTRQFGRFDFAFVVSDHTRARGEAEPLVVGAARARRVCACRCIADFSGAKMPACSARHRRAASTVRKTSAGLLAPSALMRSKSASSPPSMRLILMPVRFGIAGVK